MRIMSVCYSNDKDLLTEINAALAGNVIAIEEPTEVELPTTLDFDLAALTTLGAVVWQVLVVFGSIKASLEAIGIIVKLLRERKTKGRTAKVEFTVSSGTKITLEGNMTSEQVAEEVKRYKLALEHSNKKD